MLFRWHLSSWKYDLIPSHFILLTVPWLVRASKPFSGQSLRDFLWRTKPITFQIILSLRLEGRRGIVVVRVSLLTVRPYELACQWDDLLKYCSNLLKLEYVIGKEFKQVRSGASQSNVHITDLKATFLVYCRLELVIDTGNPFSCAALYKWRVLPKFVFLMICKVSGN